MLMARRVDELALTVPGKESLAIDAFARALRAIPTIIADNAGYDSSELVTQLRAAHYEQKAGCNAGLDMENGTIGDMSKLCITESYKSKLQVVVSAHEAAEMILRVDDVRTHTLLATVLHSLIFVHIASLCFTYSSYLYLCCVIDHQNRSSST